MTRATTGIETTRPARAHFTVRPLTATALMLCAAFVPAPAAAQAADCADPRTTTANEVCADEELRSLDDLLSRYIAAAMPALGDGAQCFEADHQQWHEGVREACGGDVPCRTHAVRRRLQELDTLLTAVPPSSEAQGGMDSIPFEVTGRLLWEQQDVGNMGLAVRDGKGAVHVIVPDMDMGSSPTHDAIRAAIASSTSATFTIRGTKSAAGGFAMNHCRIVWRTE